MTEINFENPPKNLNDRTQWLAKIKQLLTGMVAKLRKQSASEQDQESYCKAQLKAEAEREAQLKARLQSQREVDEALNVRLALRTQLQPLRRQTPCRRRRSVDWADGRAPLTDIDFQFTQLPSSICKIRFVKNPNWYITKGFFNESMYGILSIRVCKVKTIGIPGSPKVSHLQL